MAGSGVPFEVVPYNHTKGALVKNLRVKRMSVDEHICQPCLLFLNVDSNGAGFSLVLRTEQMDNVSLSKRKRRERERESESEIERGRQNCLGWLWKWLFWEPSKRVSVSLVVQGMLRRGY